MQYGWVIQPTARDRAGAADLLANNRKFLNATRGYFQTAWVEDHFQWDDRPTLECLTALAFYAAEFPEFTWGPIVLGQAYRNPALTAKMAATLHWLTGGRFVLGLGAGWKADEHTAYGWRMAPPRERVAQLAEAIQIIRLMWTQSPATFHGQYYSVENAYCEPRPEAPIPLLLGTSGEKVGLRLVAQYADWWNGAFNTPAEYAHKLDILNRHCVEMQRDPTTIKKTHYAFVSISESPERVVQREGMHVVAGSSDEVTRELEQFRALGVELLMLRFLDFPATEGLELFIQKVLPRLGERAV
ncbi:MAG: LLM class flavin-dependent oxidoreductase [Anaerolineae bacterium]